MHVCILLKYIQPIWEIQNYGSLRGCPITRCFTWMLLVHAHRKVGYLCPPPHPPCLLSKASSSFHHPPKPSLPAHLHSLGTCSHLGQTKEPIVWLRHSLWSWTQNPTADPSQTSSLSSPPSPIWVPIWKYLESEPIVATRTSDLGPIRV